MRYPGIRSTKAFAPIENLLEKKSSSYQIFHLKIGHAGHSQQMRVVALSHTTVNATSQGLKILATKACAQMSDFKPTRVLGNPYETDPWEDKIPSSKCWESEISSEA
jgi:hypothetical protein